MMNFQQRLRFPRAASRTKTLSADQRGVTIIELMIAILVFAFVASGVAVAMGTSLNTIRNNRNRSVAANLAAARMDELRAKANKDFKNDPDLATGLKVIPVTGIDNVTYTVTQDAEWVPQNSSTSACTSPTGSIPAYLRVTLKVTWPSMAGAKPVQSQTILSPPVGAYDPNTGHIAVKVMDAAGQPVAGRTVTVTGPGGTRNQNTTSDGCAFFAYLAPGAYTASMNEPGWVDRQGNPNPSFPATVSIGSTLPLQFDYDQAATLELTLGQDPPYKFPRSVPVVVSNTGLTPSGKKKFSGSTGFRTINNLFPYTSGYEVWVGDCLDNDPLVHSGARVSVDVSPGQLSTASVPMKLVEVKVFNNSGVQLGNKAVRVTHSSDTGCTSGFSLNPGSTLGTDPKVLNLSMPFGTWTFRSNANSYNWFTTALLDPNTADPVTVEIRQP